MNIHFTKEVREPEKITGYTRDRFGKKHRVSRASNNESRELLF